MAHEEDQFIKILTSEYTRLDSLFTGEVEVDLGCGSGSFTTQLSQRYPQRRIFACDVMIGRMRKVQRKASRMGLDLLTCLRVESRQLLGYMIPDAVVDRLHLLCPDPWPKDKHRANRLLVSDFVARIHGVLKPGGIFHFSSDDELYFEHGVKCVALSGLFDPALDAIDDIKDIKSDFEKRWLSQGKVVRHMAWRKCPLPCKGIGH